MKYTKRELEAMEMAIYAAGENCTEDYLRHNIELNYLTIEVGNSGRTIADYQDMDGHMGWVYVDALEPLTEEEVNKDLGYII